MPRAYKNDDEIKRKLRELKKIEMKVRLNSLELQVNSKKSFRESQNIKLVWDKFFDLKGESTKAVKYTINQLALRLKMSSRTLLKITFIMYTIGATKKVD
nr:hypothetical protein [uncultured Anaerosporobacter sp.]